MRLIKELVKIGDRGYCSMSEKDLKALLRQHRNTPQKVARPSTAPRIQSIASLARFLVQSRKDGHSGGVRRERRLTETVLSDHRLEPPPTHEFRPTPDTLRTMGYTRAVALDGGIDAWTKAGYPLEADPA